MTTIYVNVRLNCFLQKSPRMMQACTLSYIYIFWYYNILITSWSVYVLTDNTLTVMLFKVCHAISLGDYQVRCKQSYD